MDYLFFDIECANCFGGRGKAFSFGYVITDPDFSIIEKKDILINPASKFHIKGYIELFYPKETYLNSPKFDKHYPEIKALLTAPERRLFGFSALNDMHYLNADCRRYGLPSIDMKVYDVQRLHYELSGDENMSGLDKLIKHYELEDKFLHKSDDDAELSMRVLEAICRAEGCGAEELIARFPNAYSVNRNFNITFPKFPKRKKPPVNAASGD